jgi:hypothetical protein
MADNKSQFVRSFNNNELQQIRNLRNFMLIMVSNNTTSREWNKIRDEAKRKWPEKIISAVDGLRKWVIKYDKSNKAITYLGIKF